MMNRMMNRDCVAQACVVERISPRKLALVARALRGMQVTRALRELPFLKVRAAGIAWKVVKSAAANATHNSGIEKEMFIKTAVVGSKGNTRRFRAGSQGRARPIMRKLSIMSVTLGVRDGA